MLAVFVVSVQLHMVVCVSVCSKSVSAAVKPYVYNKGVCMYV